MTRMIFYYTLDGHKPKQCADPLVWGQWMSIHNQDRVVARSYIGTYMVSTVFLGIDHGFGGEVLLFETMVFDKRLRSGTSAFPECEHRCSTWEEAELQHAKTIEFVREFMKMLEPSDSTEEWKATDE